MGWICFGVWLPCDRDGYVDCGSDVRGALARLAGHGRRLHIDLGCESGQDCQGSAPGKRDPELAIGEPSAETSGGLES